MDKSCGCKGPGGCQGHDLGGDSPRHAVRTLTRARDLRRADRWTYLGGGAGLAANENGTGKSPSCFGIPGHVLGARVASRAAEPMGGAGPVGAPARSEPLDIQGAPRASVRHPTARVGSPGMTGDALNKCLDLCSNPGGYWDLAEMCRRTEGARQRALCWANVIGTPEQCSAYCWWAPNPRDWPVRGLEANT